MGWIKNRIKTEHKKHTKLDWEKITEKKIVETILDWCYKNNTIKFKNTNLEMMTLDGGWVNVLKLKEFLENGK